MADRKLIHRTDARPFAELFNDPTDFNRVFDSLEHTIMASFAIDYAVLGREPEITEEKVKARFKICEKWFRVMRGELGFGLVKTLDLIPKALACELTDQEYDPEKEGSAWFSSSIGHELDRIKSR